MHCNDVHEPHLTNCEIHVSWVKGSGPKLTAGAKWPHAWSEIVLA